MKSALARRSESLTNRQTSKAESTKRAGSSNPGSPTVQAILQLQAFAGNAAITELLERHAPPIAAPARSPQTPSVSENGHGPGIEGPSSAQQTPSPASQTPSPLAAEVPGGSSAIAAIAPMLAPLLMPKPPAANGAKAADGTPPAPTVPQSGTETKPNGAAPQAADQAAAAGAAAATTDPAPAQAPPSPDTDPNFQAVKGRVKQQAHQTRAHPPAAAKVGEAHAAAQGPANEVASQAAGSQVEKMAIQQPGGFDKKGFMDAVRKAIDAAAPKTLEEADDFKDSGKAAQVQGQVSGLVGQNKQAAEGDIKGATEAAPDTSAAQPKPVTPMPAENPGAPPASVGAASAMPTPKSAEKVSLAKGPAEVNDTMKENEVTEQQLKDSNEPEFNAALEAKGKAEEHSAQAPQAFQKDEKAILDKAKGSASGKADQDLQAMHGQRAMALMAVGSGKGQAKTEDEAKRAEVSSKVESLYATTKTEVTEILNGIDGKVDTAFKEGEEKARAAFESYVDTRMTAYKDDRYSGLIGKGRWIKDKFAGLPSEVNEFYVKGRELYLQRMEGVIGAVADIVGGELTRAKNRIELGRKQISDYVATLSPDLKKIGLEAQRNIQGKFDELTQAVDSKQDDLVNALAQKYVESRDAVDARIKEMKEANKGLIDKAKDAVMGVINTIRHLKDMLLNVLAKAASVIGNIIAHPIAFLGSLVDGVKQGLSRFMSNIGEHLKKGLLGWLFGALGDAGVQLPDHFDLHGILSIIMQVLGLTYSHIRGLAVGIVGEEVVVHLEKSLEFFQILIKEGPGGLWKWIVEKLTELKETVMTQIKEFIQEKVIIAGIMWLIGLLNPVAAFIKACKAIYDIVKFFIDRAEQVGELVNAILDSVGAIAGGALGEAAGKVENALAKGIPVAIGFLASLLGLGGISDKIKSIIHAIQEPIHNVISKVLNVVLKPFKWIGNKIKQGAAWAKKKLQQGVSYVKEKGKAGVAFVKGKVGGLFAGKKDPEHDRKVAIGLAQIDSEEKQYLHSGAISRADAQRVAAKVKADNPVFKSITVVRKDDRWDYAYAASSGVKEGPPMLLQTLKGKIEAALTGTVTLAALKTDILAAPQAQRDEVWKDAKLMSEADSKLGRDDYLTFVTLLREFEPSTGDLPEGGKAHTSASDADELIQKTLSAYVGDAVKAGRKIEGMVAVVGDADWDRAGEAAYTKKIWQGGKKGTINGFVDGKGRVWIHHDRGNAGTMIHEACHKYSSPAFIKLSWQVNEGVTEWFARKVYDELKPKKARLNYETNYQAVKVLIDLVGESTVAAAYFDGKIAELKKAVEDKNKNWTEFVKQCDAKNWTAAKAALK